MKIMLRPNVAAGDKALSHSKAYEVIGIESDYYRILDDDGGPFLYPPQLFIVVDPREPEDWVKTLGDEGELYAYPPDLNAVGFFEDYHDGKEEALRAFREYMERRSAGGRADPGKGGLP